MFLRKKQREIDKEILSEIKDSYYEDEYIITIKADNEKSIFSDFNYDSKDTLSSELCDYISKNAKHTQPDKDIKLKIHTKTNIKEDEVKTAIKSHYKREYIETKRQMEKTGFASAISLILGVLSLALLLVFHSFTQNFYLITITEIMAWVFVWEAVDKFFYVRAGEKRKLILLQKLYSCKVEIVNSQK